MENKIILSADSTCDLGPVLKEKYSVNYQPMHIVFSDKSYDDGINIFADDLFERFYKTGELPKTSAVNVGEYVDLFNPWVEQGYDVIHVNLGGALSSSHANCKIAAEEFGGKVHVIDSCNLSTGMGLIVLEAADRIAKGMPAAQIAQEVRALTSKSHASFVLDTLKFMAAGGRCSSVMAFGANVLQIKPSIEVDNNDGSMSVGKKYRGKFEKVVKDYFADQMNKYDNISPDRVFITHSGVPDGLDTEMYKYLESLNYFKEIFITRACCTISSHCGPNCIGVLFMTE